MPRDLWSDLDKPLPAGWRPRTGDKIVGTVVELAMASPTEFQAEGYPIVTVELEQGTADGGTKLDAEWVALHAFHTVLREELARNNVRVGDRIGVLFEGTPAGKRYESYRLMVDHARREELEARRLTAAPAPVAADAGFTADAVPAASTPAPAPAAPAAAPLRNATGVAVGTAGSTPGKVGWGDEEPF